MNPPLRFVALLAWTPAFTVSAQDFHWRLPLLNNSATVAGTAFGDYDGDGVNDVVTNYNPNPFLSAPWGVRILSGATGQALWSSIGVLPITGARAVDHAGDVDGDGSPDFAALVVGGAVWPGFALEVWSPRRNALLWYYSGGRTTENFGGLVFDSHMMAGDLDLNGDGRSEFMVISSGPTESDLYAFDSSGALLYRIPFLPNGGWRANCITTMPDMDGDGARDLLLGIGNGQLGVGTLTLLSGRTGSVIRVTPDLHPGDFQGGAVANAGDVDGDGVADYAGASYYTSPLTNIAIFSGATGAVIHQWNDYWCYFDNLVGDIDVDLDGVPDLLVGNGGYPLTPALSGQIRCYSGRDGSVLWNHNSADGVEYFQANSFWALGPRPGNPYPLIGWTDGNYYRNGSFGRLVTLDTRLKGAGRLVGDGFSSTGSTPDIGIRKANGRVRITLADAPSTAFAWLAVAGASESTLGGLALPLDLAPFGLSGCTAYVPPTLTGTTLTSGTADPLGAGFGWVDLPIPQLNPTGIPFAAQWLVLDPFTGAYATSPRHEFRAL